MSCAASSGSGSRTGNGSAPWAATQGAVMDLVRVVEDRQVPLDANKDGWGCESYG